MRAACQGIGGEPNAIVDYACPVVEFYVDEDKDLGGWTALPTNVQEDEGDEAVAVADTGGAGERMGSGKLMRRIEMFNWGDDLDLEGICYWCGGPVIFENY